MDEYAAPPAQGAPAQGAELPLMHTMPLVAGGPYLPHLDHHDDDDGEAGHAQDGGADASPGDPHAEADDGGGAHAGGSGKYRGGVLFCQVDTCRAPLEGLKDYHQRYKVCEEHLKMESIERDGARLRFCQQCGRFQPLGDFDAAKRSCRARLQRHNARRRKRSRSEGYATAAPADVAAAMGVDDMAAVQEAVAFASATLVHTTAAGGAPPRDSGDPDPAGAAAAIAGLPFGGGLTAMPFVPSPKVMLLLLKGYAGMFHYVLEDVQLRPLAPPTAGLMEMGLPPADAGAVAVAAAAAAAAAAAGAPHDEAAVAHLMAMHAGALGQHLGMGGDVGAAMAAAVAAQQLQEQQQQYAAGGAAAPQ